MIRFFLLFIVYGLFCLYLYSIDKAIYLAAVAAAPFFALGCANFIKK